MNNENNEIMWIMSITVIMRNEIMYNNSKIIIMVWNNVKIMK